VKKKTAPTFKKTTSSSIVDTQEEFEESVLCSDYFVDSSVFGEIRRVESTAMSSSPENTTVSCLLVSLRFDNKCSVEPTKLYQSGS